MSAHVELAWAEQNQRLLTEALRRIRWHLERKRQPADEVEAAGGAPGEGDSTAPVPETLRGVRSSFGLSDFETDLLLLCAGVELDASFAELVGSLQQRSHPPTFGLALAALPDPHWSALTPGGPLRRWRLIEVGVGEQLVTSPLRIDERVLHHLAGLQSPDAQLAGFIEPTPTTGGVLPPSQEALVATAIGVWSAVSGVPPVLQLLGAATPEKRWVAGAVAERLGFRLHLMPAHVIPGGANEREVLMRLWEREAVLGGSVLLIEADELSASDGERMSHLRDFLEGTRAAVILATRERLTLPHRESMTLEVRRPTTVEQRDLWVAALGERAEALNGQIDGLAAQFDLGAGAIESASRQAFALADAEGLGARLWAACRGQARPRLSDLAQPIPPSAAWEDLVLPELQTQMLREVTLHVRERLTVYERWGFAARSSRGLGVTALFAGPSGTGKTMAAEVLAAELDLDLYRIDLSRVVSKYIGETEKNLSRIFDAAEEGGAILLFDEADALFGKRSEVKDSHDRYANIEVSYLLQRMEAYRGLAILTTNLKSSLDDAFLRRLRFVITFPFPSVIQRAHIWRRIFPVEAPTRGLDVDKLARLNVAGGNIRNIALGAAFLAAGDGEAVGMEHVLRAARSEYAKLERPHTDAEIRGWT